MSKTVEINIDALVGPTHHYSGMGVGNLASIRHKHRASSPKLAALEGLRKAKILADLGIPQFILPPAKRPSLHLLDHFGYCGSPEEQLRAAWNDNPELLSTIYSSSFMWAANSATVTPAADSHDGKLHLTVANLISSIHRSIEAVDRVEQFRRMFKPLEPHVAIHAPLLATVPLRDEGAANHMRLSTPQSPLGFNVFVHGDSANAPPTSDQPSTATRFLARHTLAASKMLERIHRLDSSRTFHLQQHPQAISAGVFHNDVIATSHQHVLLQHELAFADGSDATLARLENAFQSTFDQPLQRLFVRESDLSLSDAVDSYLFNSQIVCPPNGPRMMLISPQQCREIKAAETVIDRWIADPDVPIEAVEYVELRESMAGGGGPACLRLRVPMTEDHVSLFAPNCRLDDARYDRMVDAIERYYPDRLVLDDLVEIDLAHQAWTANDAISGILEL